MRKKYIFGKKLYISILTTIVVLLTTVATTFAWVGVFANSTFDTFEFNIKPSQVSEDYNIVVSSTGLPGTFRDSIQDVDIKKQILLNWGYQEEIFLKTGANNTLIDDEDKINNYFNMLRLDQATNLPIINGNELVKLGDFYDVYEQPTKKYFKFDVYVAIEPVKMDVSTSDFLLDVFLNTDALSSDYKGRQLYNSVFYPNDFVHPYDILINNGMMTLPSGARTVRASEEIKYASVKSVYAARLAFEKYEVVDQGDVNSYLGKQPKSAIIYSGDEYDYPICLNETRKEYNFGGILPNELNLSTLNYNSSEWRYAHWGYWVMDLPHEIYEARGVESPTKDLIINRSTNHIINSEKENEKIGIGKMMKLTVYFWFEGWDADCWNAINNSPVSIDLRFKMRNEDD